MVRQIDDRDLGRVVAAEECGADVQTLGQERRRRRDGGHFGEAGELGLRVGLVDFGAVGLVGAGGGCVVVDDYEVDGAGGLEEGEEGVVLVGFAAVDECEGRLALDEGGVRVVVEGVGVGGEFVHEGQGVGSAFRISVSVLLVCLEMV